jgi:hypothetical protein
MEGHNQGGWMKRLTYSLLVAMAVMLLAACARHAVNVPVREGHAGPADSAEFLQRLQRMADQGNLFEPRDARRILGFRLTASVKETHPTDCSKSYGIRDSHNTTLEQSEGSWYRPLPSGAGHIDIPAAFINPASTTGDARLEYRISHAVYCTDDVGMQDYMNAQMTFENLPSYACITSADILKVIPKAQLHMATDGVFLVDYQGRVDDEAGMSLQFVYRMGATCALDATLRQDKKKGLRFQRASATYEACSVGAKKNYCATHPHPTWGNGEALGDMRTYANKICGTENALYLREPANGRSPPPAPAAGANRPLWNGPLSGPCDQY